MRNPFRLRASQRAVNDEQFVKLFGAGALDLIDNICDPFGGLVILRSAPGGGKTSFLRLMTPRPLRVASLLHDDIHSRPTYDALRSKGAIDDAGASLMGVLVTFTPEYRDLDDIDRGLGMFRALLNARIVIATVRAILERSNRTYPDDLETVQANWNPDVDVTIPAIANGRELYDWAAGIERNFYDRLDDLGDGESTGGHTRLDALKWFSTARLADVHGEISTKRLLMLDDLQLLSDDQRKSLMEILATARADCGIWVAERMEALNYQEILSEGALRGRDYEGVVQLENLWANRYKAYSKFVSQIADLRARRADGFEDRDFFGLLAEGDDSVRWDSEYEKACEAIRIRIDRRTNKNVRYEGWIDAAKEMDGSPYEMAVHWRATEILIERDLARGQRSFDFDKLSNEEFSTKDSSGLRSAARHFLRTELRAPIYYGRGTLATVSSWNVDQYVDVTGDIFEELSAKITGPRATPPSLTTDRQHEIIKTVALRRWQAMPRRLPQGYDARRLLEAAAHFCQSQTFRKTAPYAPGVTGFAITMDDRAKLIGRSSDGSTYYQKLRDVLASLVAHNEIVPRLDHRNKGREYVVFYLNRLVCVHFDLPLGYGGWREKSLQDLSLWLEQGSAAVKEVRLVE